MATAPHPLLRPYQPSDEDPFDAVKAAHLLNRAGFGGTPDDVAKVLKLGPQGAVDALFDFPDAGVEEQNQTDAPDFSGIEGYPRTFRELNQKVASLSPDERKEYRQMLQRANQQAMQQTAHWWLDRMAYGPHRLQEKLALFWHGHFTTSARDERSANAMWNQNEVLRRNAAGNFRTFVREVSRDPAMLDYLNNTQNRKAHPNENYARELMELFTLGIGNYTEDDIKQAARAFTGWAHDGDDYVFRKFDHDDEDKTFFGRTGNFNGDDVIDLILASPACARHIAGKLYRHFVTEDLDDSLADNLAAQLREADYELRPLLRTIFTSRAFYRPGAIGAQVKSPVQLVIGTVRSLDIEMPRGGPLTPAFQQMGQIPLDPPNVKGWPGGRTWITTSTLFARYNTCVWLAGGVTRVAISNRVKQNKAGFLRQAEAPSGFDPADARSDDPAAVVDEWLARLVARPVDAAQRDTLVAAAAATPAAGDARTKKVVQLIVSMPEYQLC